MTAVIERSRWKYRMARAYRVLLTEAGHLCQVFYLVATALGLAPFCTMALAGALRGTLSLIWIFVRRLESSNALSCLVP